jgi:hypothetical protein
MSGKTRACASCPPPPDQLGARGDVAPLVAAAHLELAVVGAEEVPEVVRLGKHVAEFGERDSRLHPALHRFLLQHVADGEVLPGVTEKSRSRIGRSQSALFLILAALAPSKVRNRSSCALIAWRWHRCARPRVSGALPLPAGISHHAGAATNDDDRRSAGPLEPGQSHDRNQIPDMQRIRCRIEPDVSRNRALSQSVWQTRGRVVNESTLAEKAEKVRHGAEC